VIRLCGTVLGFTYPVLVYLALRTLGPKSVAGFLGRGFLFVPVAINAWLLSKFLLSLRPGARPAIERFARLVHDDLSAQEVAWCRLFTKIWAGFFFVNGSMALWLALAAPLSWWAVYNGGIAYGLIGALLGIELVLRKRRFPRHKIRSSIVVENVSAAGGDWHGRAAVPENLIYFQGHFESFPVLPAVSILELLVASGVGNAWPDLHRIQRLSRLKFRRAVLPGDVLDLHLSRVAPATVQFTIRRGEDVCSSGQLEYAQEGA
jgi:uncharacterized membrane protein/3-hydroxymyristoyl/3-hydroxydecanoyl-(acyl carrier protein) dehydratase